MAVTKQRLCCVCRTRKEADQGLIRIARERQADGSFKYFVDAAGNANGRGAYVCRECIGKAVKTRALNRSFKTNINNEVYEKLESFKATEK